jgi:hypothetical protein
MLRAPTLAVGYLINLAFFVDLLLMCVVCQEAVAAKFGVVHRLLFGLLQGL